MSVTPDCVPVAARPKLTITRGLPASGKTTWAKAQTGAVRVNRDELRRMFAGAAWDHRCAADEDVVTEVQFEAIAAWLARRRHVIVDDTNLPDEVVKALRRFAAGHHAEFAIQDFSGVPVEVCIARDAARPEAERVGEKVIRGMWERYLAPRPTSDVRPVEAGDQTLGEIK